MHETTTGNRGPGWKLFALSFAALFLELMLIRWVPSAVRLVAYYANLMLISSFLGLGLGALLSMRGWRLWRWFVPLLALEVGLVLACRSFAMPGSAYEARFFENYPQLGNYLVLVATFLINTAVFVPLGEQIGRLFHELPALRAYTWDLGGSLCGTLAFAAFSLFMFSPVIGVAIVLLIVLALGGRRLLALRVALAIAVALGVALTTRRDATWSPYYYITIDNNRGGPAGDPPPDLRTMQDPPGYLIRVNQDFYQGNATINAARYTNGVIPPELTAAAAQYPVPHLLRPGAKRVLVLGAGGGLDVEAALLAGAEHVDAVEIDAALVNLSKRYNPAGVYADARVRVHVDDGRAFMERARGGYDMIVLGYLDSQALFSYGANVRLDGFIYTVESFRQAYKLLAPGGLLAVSFAAPRDWLAMKLVEMVRDATGVEPLIYQSGPEVTVLAPAPGLTLAPREVPDFVPATTPRTLIARATDDWPYLYLLNRSIPRDYLLVIGTLIGASLLAVFLLRGRTVSPREDGHFFFLGVGFLLLQAKSIGDCSLYFGATWLVTTIVITGALLMVLAANFVAIRLRRFSPWFYAPLIASLVLLAMTDRQWVLGLPYGARLAWALLVVPLPIFFAGLVFSTTFRDAAVPSAVFGANLIGATVGGFSEYLGMAMGTHRLWWVVIAAYVCSFLCRVTAARTQPSRAIPADAAEPLAA